MPREPHSTAWSPQSRGHQGNLMEEHVPRGQGLGYIPGTIRTGRARVTWTASSKSQLPWRAVYSVQLLGKKRKL